MWKILWYFFYCLMIGYFSLAIGYVRTKSDKKWHCIIGLAVMLVGTSTILYGVFILLNNPMGWFLLASPIIALGIIFAIDSIKLIVETRDTIAVLLLAFSLIILLIIFTIPTSEERLTMWVTQVTVVSLVIVLTSFFAVGISARGMKVKGRK